MRSQSLLWRNLVPMSSVCSDCRVKDHCDNMRKWIVTYHWVIDWCVASASRLYLLTAPPHQHQGYEPRDPFDTTV